jgi:uncharacterized protein involved in outer membrane biogenesis
MRVALKVLAAAGALAGTAIVVVGIALATLDPTVFAGPIGERVKAATGRDFGARRIRISASLTPRIVLDGVTLGNAPWAVAPQMVTAKAVELEVALIPLLQRRLEVRRLVLTEPAIALESDASGRGNWELGPASAADSAPSAARTDAPSLAALGVNDVVVNGGSIAYRAGTSATTTVVVIERLALSASDAHSPIAVDARGVVDQLPIALAGKLPSADALWRRQGALPVQLEGEVAGRKAALKGSIRADGRGVAFEELDVAYGANRVTGRFAIAPGAIRPVFDATLDAATLTVAELPPIGAPAATATQSAKSAAPASRAPHVFADDAASLASLHGADGKAALRIGRRVLRDGRTLERIETHFTLRDGRLDVSRLTVSVFGGTATAQLKVDAANERAAAIALKLDATGLELPALLAAAGIERNVRGGRTNVALDVSMRGASPRQWVSSLNGSALASIGAATLGNDKASTTTPLDRLAELVNPFRAVDTTTELQCAVARLPLKDGVARFERGIGIETKKIGVLASGTLDFRNETMDVALRPHARSGVSLDLVRLADLVRLRGTCAAPSVAVDAVGSATTVARVGAAVATSGLSIVGESLLRGVAGGGNECEIARSSGGAGSVVQAEPTRAPAADAPAKGAERGFPNALERLFRH